MFGFLLEQPNSNTHHLNRLIKILNHFISIEPPKKIKGYESHHIVPRSWKPECEFEKDNLLRVPAKAHYVIHHLLWKAFPKDYSMTEAFHQMSHRQQKQRITAKVYEILRLEFSQAQRNNALKRVFDGTHPFSGPELNKKRVIDGTHPFLGGELTRKRVANGTHNFCGSGYNKTRVANGTHNFLGGEISRRNSQIKKTCPHCNKEIPFANFAQWHGDKCKLKTTCL